MKIIFDKTFLSELKQGGNTLIINSYQFVKNTWESDGSVNDIFNEGRLNTFINATGNVKGEYTKRYEDNFYPLWEESTKHLKFGVTLPTEIFYTESKESESGIKEEPIHFVYVYYTTPRAVYDKSINEFVEEKIIRPAFVIVEQDEEGNFLKLNDKLSVGNTTIFTIKFPKNLIKANIQALGNTDTEFLEGRGISYGVNVFSINLEDYFDDKLSELEVSKKSYEVWNKNIKSNGGKNYPDTPNCLNIFGEKLGSKERVYKKYENLTIDTLPDTIIGSYSIPVKQNLNRDFISGCGEEFNLIQFTGTVDLIEYQINDKGNIVELTRRTLNIQEVPEVSLVTVKVEDNPLIDHVIDQKNKIFLYRKVSEDNLNTNPMCGVYFEISYVDHKGIIRLVTNKIGTFDYCLLLVQGNLTDQSADISCEDLAIGYQYPRKYKYGNVDAFAFPNYENSTALFKIRTENFIGESEINLYIVDDGGELNIDEDNITAGRYFKFERLENDDNTSQSIKEYKVGISTKNIIESSQWQPTSRGSSRKPVKLRIVVKDSATGYRKHYDLYCAQKGNSTVDLSASLYTNDDWIEELEPHKENDKIIPGVYKLIIPKDVVDHYTFNISGDVNISPDWFVEGIIPEEAVINPLNETTGRPGDEEVITGELGTPVYLYVNLNSTSVKPVDLSPITFYNFTPTAVNQSPSDSFLEYLETPSSTLLMEREGQDGDAAFVNLKKGEIPLRNYSQEINLYRFGIKTNGPVKLELKPNLPLLFKKNIVIFNDIDSNSSENFSEGSEIEIKSVYDSNRILNVGLKLKDNLFPYESEILEDTDGVKLKKYEYGSLTITALENNKEGKSQSANIVVYTRDVDPEPIMKTDWDSDVKLVSYEHEEESVDSFIVTSYDYLILPEKNEISNHPYFLSSDTPFTGFEPKNYGPKVDCEVSIDSSPRKLSEVGRDNTIVVLPKDSVYYLGLHYSFGISPDDYTGMYVKVGYFEDVDGENVEKSINTLRFCYEEDEMPFGYGNFDIISNSYNPGYFIGVPIRNKIYEDPNTKNLYELDNNGNLSKLESNTADLFITNHPEFDRSGYIKHDCIIEWKNNNFKNTYPVKEIAKITLNSINTFSEISSTDGLILFDGIKFPRGSSVNSLLYSGKLEDRHKKGIYLYFDNIFKKAFYITDNKGKYSYNLSGTSTSPIIDYENFAVLRSGVEFIPIQGRSYLDLSESKIYKAEEKSTSSGVVFVDLISSTDYRGTNVKTYGVIKRALPPKISFTTDPEASTTSSIHWYLPYEKNFTDEITFYSPYEVTAKLKNEGDDSVVEILSLTKDNSVWEDGFGYKYSLRLMSKQQGSDDVTEDINLASIILTSELNREVSVTDNDGNVTSYSEILDKNSLDLDVSSEVFYEIWEKLVDELTGGVENLTATREIKLGQYGSLAGIVVTSERGTVIKEETPEKVDGKMIGLNTIDVYPTKNLDDIFTYTAPVDKAWIDTESIEVTYDILGNELNEEEQDLFGVSSQKDLYHLPILDEYIWTGDSVVNKMKITIPKKLFASSLYQNGFSLDQYYDNSNNNAVSYFNERVLNWLKKKWWGSQDVSMNYRWIKYDPETKESTSFEQKWTVRNKFSTYPIYQGILYNSEKNINKFFIYDGSDNILTETVNCDTTEIPVHMLLMDTHEGPIWELDDMNIGMGLSGERPKIQEHDSGIVVEGLKDRPDQSYSPGFDKTRCNLCIKLDSINEDTVDKKRSFFVNYEETTRSGSTDASLRVLHRLKVTVIQKALEPKIELIEGNGIYDRNNIYVHSSGSVLDLSDENNISSTNSISFYTNIPQKYLAIKCNDVKCPIDSWIISYGNKEDNGLYKVTVSNIVFPENISRQTIIREISIYHYNPDSEKEVDENDKTKVNVYQGYYSLDLSDLSGNSYGLIVGDYDNPLIGAPRSYNQVGFDRNVFSLILTQAEYYRPGDLEETTLSYYGCFGISDNNVVWQRASKDSDGDIILSDISGLIENYETSFVTTTSTPELTDKIPFIENEYISKELSYSLDFLIYIKVPIMLKYPDDDLICPGAEVIDQYIEFWIKKQAE